MATDTMNNTQSNPDAAQEAEEWETDYTPGPWRYEIDHIEPKLHCTWTNEQGVDQMSVLVARTCFAPASLANARLIAVGPLLHFALDQLLSHPHDLHAQQLAREALERIREYASHNTNTWARDISAMALYPLAQSRTGEVQP